MVRIKVNPSVIRWACARSGRSVEDLRKRFPRLMDWERGRVRPTLKQMEALAKATFTPIGFFFFEEPPVDELPVPDFRTMDNAEVRRPSPHLLNTTYLCQQRLVLRHVSIDTWLNCRLPYVRQHVGEIPLWTRIPINLTVY